MSALVFMDTETTGLDLADDIWEFAAIRREPDGSEEELHLLIDHDKRKCAQLPESFRANHAARWDGTIAVTRADAAVQIQHILRDRAHVVGAVPNFDTERIARLLTRRHLAAPWHYHLIDVENLAVGYLAGLRAAGGGENGHDADLPSLPWTSDDLSRAVGVEPPTTERHTAIGDVRWAMAIYDRITASA